jgi:hypothetical protein
MNHFIKAVLAVLVLVFFPFPPSARGDGGMVRFARISGNYRITVFTSPTPLRQGMVDFSVLVQEARTGKSFSNTEVTLDFIPLEHQAAAMHYAATSAAATNKLLKSAVFNLPAAGKWQVEATVAGPRGPTQVAFLINAAPALPRWIDLGMWIILPAVPIFLFGIQQFFKERTLKTPLYKMRDF